jgi:long-chain fatty acid transport protein
MSIPLGVFGGVGFGMLQRYTAASRLEFVDSAANADALAEIRGSLFELSPAYAYRFPGFLRALSLGAQYRLFFGNSLYETRTGASLADTTHDWLTDGVTIGHKTTVDWDVKSDWWRNLRGALHWHGRSVDFFFSYAPQIDLERTLGTKTQFSNTDTLHPRSSVQKIAYPELLSTGLRLRFGKRHNLGLEYSQQNFDGTMPTLTDETVELQASRKAALIYQLEGSGLHYDGFFKRHTFRVGGWYKALYLKDANEFGGTLGTGLYLGRRGTKIDIDLLGGARSAQEDEAFFGVELTLTGVGNWGESSR